MSYTVTVSGTTFTVGMSSVDYAVTLSQVGQQGAAGPTGISWLGAWALSTDFALRDVVSNNGSSHICIQAHTSSATDEPGVGANAATYWEVLAAKGVDGSGTGTVTSIDVAGGTGLTSSGGPVTSSGTITVGLDAATVASLALANTAQQPPSEGAFVNGDKTKLDGIEDGADVTDTANVTAAGALMDSEVTNLAQVKAFDSSDYATAAQGALADTAAQPDDVETVDLNAQTGATYTLVIGDRGQTVITNSASANTVTIPTNASVAFDVGSVVTVIQIGSGVTTIEGDTGVTVNGTSGGSVDISAQYQGVSLLKVAANTWIASGAI